MRTDSPGPDAFGSPRHLADLRGHIGIVFAAIDAQAIDPHFVGRLEPKTHTVAALAENQEPRTKNPPSPGAVVVDAYTGRAQNHAPPAAQEEVILLLQTPAHL